MFTRSLNIRMFSAGCGFTADFPLLVETSSYNRALYNHLRGIYMIDQEHQAKFMSLTEKTDEKSQAQMTELRKEMATNSQKVKMFEELKHLFVACDEN